MNNETMDKTSIRDKIRKEDQLNPAASTQPSMQARQFTRVSSRIFCMDGEWFFQTRDNDHGPFTRREACEQALERFVSEKLLTA